MRRALLCLALLACDPPPVVATADKRQQEESERIEGTVVATGAARGDVILFLYDAAKPPPPTGTGRPLTFATVKRTDLFGTATDNGPFSAPYTFSLVKNGSYLIRGLIDTGGDFIPWYSVTSDANAGDVGGAAIDPVTRASRVVTVDGGVVSDVGVSFSDAARVPVDRPAFQIESTSPSATVVQGMPPAILELRPQPLDLGVVHQRQPVFLAQLIDDDLDGFPDDKNGDGVPDMWPRVIVRKIADGPNLLLDDPKPIVLAAGFDPTDLLPVLLDMNGRPRTSAVPVTKLKLVVRPLALDVTNPTMPMMMSTLPPGRYAIVLIAPTGQTWRVPNELAPQLAIGLGLPEVTSQAFVIQVP
jgi:hypothetical protein